jgi:superoxide dismutase, Cu-Zn family
MKRTLCIAASTLFAACTRLGDEQLRRGPTVQNAQGTVEMAVLAQATLEGKSGENVSGLARFSVDHGVVTMDLSLTGVPPGIHAVHLAENGDCSAMDASTTGEHWNPTRAAHGRFDTPPYHLGDIGDLHSGDNGVASLVFATEEWSIGTGMINDVIGRAVLIEHDKDDFRTQPDGASGAHIGCGRIEATAGMPPPVSTASTAR